MTIVNKIARFVKRNEVEKARRMLWKESRLVFVCPVTMQEVPCGLDGCGYKVKISTD